MKVNNCVRIIAPLLSGKELKDKRLQLTNSFHSLLSCSRREKLQNGTMEGDKMTNKNKTNKDKKQPNPYIDQIVRKNLDKKAGKK